jgi:cytochrome c peroxidase
LKRPGEALPVVPDPQGPKPELSFKYKARPLNGIWATAPYLHNGSVPNLDELLKPASKRVTSFKVGSREFDPIKVGLVDDGNFNFDTKQVGNTNVGHDAYKKNGEEYSAEERKALIEYMKTL